MDFFRIGEKLIDPQGSTDRVDRVLSLAAAGVFPAGGGQKAQAGAEFYLPPGKPGRGEKGKKLGILGFPIKNKEEIRGLPGKGGL
jgi:hypothetical protein